MFASGRFRRSYATVCRAGGGRTANLRQPAQVDSVHADEQHTGDDAVSTVRVDWHSAAARHRDDPVHRPRHRHCACRVIRLRAGGLRHNDTQATRS